MFDLLYKQMIHHWFDQYGIHNIPATESEPNSSIPRLIARSAKLHQQHFFRHAIPALIWINRGEMISQKESTCHTYIAQQFHINLLQQPTYVTVKGDKKQNFQALYYFLDLNEFAKFQHLAPKKDNDNINSPELTLIKHDKLLGCLARLLDLYNCPKDIEIIQPLIHKELHYYLMTSQIGGNIVDFLFGQEKQTALLQAVNWINQHYTEPLSIPLLAKQISMSEASLYKGFKTLTGFSPLQYQKTLRLQKAKALLAENTSVTATCYHIGYESVTQFSREYHRMFGIQPSKQKSVLQYKSNN
ncbi:helix-turn-helix domain-containing protein [Volucribacter psittacicida]|nr:helix-turn-helix domain-containing protein [Volucribacter psittacicida]